MLLGSSKREFGNADDILGNDNLCKECHDLRDVINLDIIVTTTLSSSFFEVAITTSTSQRMRLSMSESAMKEDRHIQKRMSKNQWDKAIHTDIHTSHSD